MSALSRLSHRRIIKEIVMIILGLASILLLLMDIFANLNLGNHQLLGLIDIGLCFIFLIDFFWHMHLSPSTPKVFLRRHWLELLAAIPITSVALTGISIIHIFRIARLAIRIRILLEVSQEYTRHAYLIYVFVISSLVILSGAAGFYYFEFGVNPNVHTFFDAVWWAIVTSTTIGYGDIYPITLGGRLIAIVVMLIGITAFGTFIATIESQLIKRRQKKFKKTK